MCAPFTYKSSKDMPFVSRKTFIFAHPLFLPFITLNLSEKYEQDFSR